MPASLIASLERLYLDKRKAGESSFTRAEEGRYEQEKNEHDTTNNHGIILTSIGGGNGGGSLVFLGPYSTFSTSFMALRRVSLGSAPTAT